MSIILNNVSKRFTNSDRDTLSDVSLEIRDGEFMCLLGPSGCGKSTVLNLVAGLTKPSEGAITVDGKPLNGAGADRVMMFQESALFPWLNVIENVKFGLKIAGKSKAEQDEIARHYLEMVRLSDFAEYRPHELSGGMKQRVALARSLALDSRVLLMDEPFAALDKQTKNILRNEIERIWLETRKTIVFVTHSVEEAIFFADRIVMMSANPGRIKKIYDIDFPRPRHIDSSDFVELRHLLLEEIKDEAASSEVAFVKKAHTDRGGAQ